MLYEGYNMGHKERKRVRKIIAIIFIILMTASEYLIFSMIEFKVGFLNNNNIRKAVSETTYVNLAQEEFNNEVTELLSGYGLPTYISEKIESDADVYNKVHSNLEKNYSGINTQADYTDVTEKLETMLEAYVLSGVITEAQLSEISNAFEEICENILVFDFAVQLNSVNSEYYGKMLLTFTASIIILIFSIISMWTLYDLKHRAVRTYFYSTVSCTILNIALTTFVVLRKTAYTSGFAGKFYQSTIEAYYKCSLNAFYAGIAICILISAIEFCVIRHIKASY
jgi:hypothetical protein